MHFHLLPEHPATTAKTKFENVVVRRPTSR
jgi:hypothetical protein